MHLKKLILTALLLLVAGVTGAKPVDPSVARRVAENLLHKSVINATPADFSQCYLFAGADGKGFVLVASDDCVRPILAYSHDGQFFPNDSSNQAIEQSCLPQHIAHWINAYQINIAALIEAGAVASPKVQAEWQSLLNNKYHRVRDNAVEPLLTTRWNQGYPYNLQCPYSTADSAYSVTGCVATATAQVMKYWNHPAVGRGSHSYSIPGFGTLSAVFDTTHYDWTHMPDSPDGLSTDQERNAVAQLMYHIGVAVEMNYSPQSSGAFVASDGNTSMASSENALKNYFRYNQALFSAAKADHNDSEWDALLTSELDVSRPMVISGHDNSGGHAFVLDGYDTLGFFHVNWGWGGYCDGYYTLDSLNPDGSGIGGNATNGYNNDNKVLLHVYPASENPSVTVSVASANPLQGTASGGGTFSPYAQNTSLLATATEGHRFTSWKSGCHYNPFRFSPNTDISDTALFAPLGGDTLSYCYGNNKGLWGSFEHFPLEWGIRLPASTIAPHRQLEKVQLYCVSEADYTINIYSGNGLERLLSSTSYSSGFWGWHTIHLTNPVPLYDTLPIWVVVSCGTYTNPASYSSYSGNPDGCWFKRNGTTWGQVTEGGEYLSWMLRALLGPLQPVDIDVQSSDPEKGTVSGSGSYFPGDTAILLATPAPGYRFAGWSTGDTDNPLYLRVTSPSSIIGSFLPAAGIEEIENSKLKIEISGLYLQVENPTGRPFDLYDITGRHLATSHLSSFTFHLPTPGVYLLRSGSTVQKIVAIK